MHLILLHGYLLQGTGSNIYVANIAKAWKNQGHAVTVVCQDPTSANLGFVDEFYGSADDIPSHPPSEGSIRVVIPDIAGLLPVYVFDRYDGYQVKTIPEMSDQECQRHIDMSSDTLVKVAEQGASLVLANHALFGPIIARRALSDLPVPYHVKIHGSAVEYTLVPHPELMHYAVDGLKNAQRIIVGTRYVKNRVLEVFASERSLLELGEKLQIVPPGMDPELFKPAIDFETNQHGFLNNVKRMIRENKNGRKSSLIHKPDVKSQGSYHDALVQVAESYDQRAVDVDLPEKWPQVEPHDPIILYFGKFLAAKGVGEVLMTIPAVLSKIPEARFIFVGFGTYREHLEGMIQALADGDEELFLECARAGDLIETKNSGRWFRTLTSREMDRITITGILDHDTLGQLLPLASLTIVPSKWPEAFGMVAVEAMAAGVLPLCNDHAGLRDVIEAVEIQDSEIAALMRLDRMNFVEQLPPKIESALNFLYPAGFSNHHHRQTIAEKLRRISVDQFSWDGIARKLI